jgi:hypothetical protein
MLTEQAMRIVRFLVTNYRNIKNSGWINVSDVTAIVGPNEAGKSNYFEALYRINPFEPKAAYDVNEDWPVDNWSEMDPAATVCVAEFVIDDPDEMESLFEECRVEPKTESDGGGGLDHFFQALPAKTLLIAERRYDSRTSFSVGEEISKRLDATKLQSWAKRHVPQFVYIHDYDLSGNTVELNTLASKLASSGWKSLSNDEQTILIILSLAKIEINDFVEQGNSPEGRTKRAYNKRAASKYLTEQFQKLWTQKKVRFEIEIDGPTLNILVQDDGMDMPIRLHRRSTGFRWHVSFAWRFTHASSGDYQNCILLLEEPGVHLHPDGQRDLLNLFNQLALSNTILYTTHLASMIDPAYPERVRISEVVGHHARVIEGVVCSNRSPMAVIEARLGLRGDLSGLLGSRQTLIVEGGDEVLVLTKLSGVLAAAGRQSLSPRIYMWPAEGAPKTPMFAGFLIGQGWQGAVLLDTDEAGEEAAKKIRELYLKEIANQNEHSFKILSLSHAAGIGKTNAAIEDMFPDETYISWVNDAYRLRIGVNDLPVDGSTMITKRIKTVLQSQHGGLKLDKRLVMSQMLKSFDLWRSVEDLPPGTADHAEKLFNAINTAFVR